MKKRNLLFLAISFLTISAMAVAPSGVVINGVTWATCNVDAPGTFAASPEAYGSFYQWNSNTAWATTGTASGWNSFWTGGFTNPSSSDTWANANDPSPAGYQVPTYAQIESLLNSTYVTNVWTTQNSVYGRKFTDNTTGNSIFLPASGRLFDYNGTLGNAGDGVFYWSSTCSGSSAFILGISSQSFWQGSRASGYAIRPVASSGTPVYNTKASNLKINTTNGKAEISGLPQGTRVAVYNLQGVAIYSEKATAESISVNLPARGVYVVKVGNESVKVVY